MEATDRALAQKEAAKLIKVSFCQTPDKIMAHNLSNFLFTLQKVVIMPKNTAVNQLDL